MEKMKTGQRIITTLSVHGHQSRLIYALTMLLIAKIIIFWLLGIRQGGKTAYQSGVGSFTITFPITFSILYGAYSSMLKNGDVGDYRDVFSASTKNMTVGRDNCARYWLAVGQ